MRRSSKGHGFRIEVGIASRVPPEIELSRIACGVALSRTTRTRHRIRGARVARVGKCPAARHADVGGERRPRRGPRTPWHGRGRWWRAPCRRVSVVVGAGRPSSAAPSNTCVAMDAAPSPGEMGIRLVTPWPVSSRTSDPTTSRTSRRSSPPGRGTGAVVGHPGGPRAICHQCGSCRRVNAGNRTDPRTTVAAPSASAPIPAGGA